MNWKGWSALETERQSSGRRRHPGFVSYSFVSYTSEHKRLTRKRKILLQIFDLQHLKGRLISKKYRVFLRHVPRQKRFLRNKW